MREIPTRKLFFYLYIAKTTCRSFRTRREKNPLFPYYLTKLSKALLTRLTEDFIILKIINGNNVA